MSQKEELGQNGKVMSEERLLFCQLYYAQFVKHVCIVTSLTRNSFFIRNHAIGKRWATARVSMTEWAVFANSLDHYCDVIMGAMTSQISSLTIVYSSVHSGADQRKHQSSASLAFVRGIHRWPVNSPHKWPVTRKMFPFDEVIMSGMGVLL